VTTRGAWLRRGAGVVVAYLAISLALPTDRTKPWRVAAAALFVVALAWLRRATGQGERPEHPAPPEAYDLGPPDEQLIRLARLESAFGFAVESHRQFDKALRPLLCRLVEDRLSSHHGVDLAARPAEARALMGEELWQLVEDERADRTHPGPGPAPERLQQLVGAVRAL
jgi:hypothetical protein